VARPSKPLVILKNEKRSHRTKSELLVREQYEKKLQSNSNIKMKNETKNNKTASKEFKRIVELLKKIEKDDALYENIINRYAIIYAECREFEQKQEQISKQLSNLEEEYIKNKDLNTKEFYTLITNINKNIIDIDKQLQSKRKMMLDIEKENIMTIASQLRSIPKNIEKEENPLLKVLRGEA